jgi:hypothetical protein
MLDSHRQRIIKGASGHNLTHDVDEQGRYTRIRGTLSFTPKDLKAAYSAEATRPEVGSESLVADAVRDTLVAKLGLPDTEARTLGRMMGRVHEDRFLFATGLCGSAEIKIWVTHRLPDDRSVAIGVGGGSDPASRLVYVDDDRCAMIDTATRITRYDLRPANA